MGPVPLARSDRKLILVTGAVVIFAGLLWAAVLFLNPSGGDTPNKGASNQLYIGPKRDLVVRLDEGSPLYFANPFGGRGFWLDRENGGLIVLDVGSWRDVGCSIAWRGRINTFVDCHGNHLTKDQMARHPVTVVETGSRKGSVLVDLETLTAPPGATSAN